MKILSCAWCCFWYEIVASVFRFHRFLFSGVTAVIPVSHRIRPSLFVARVIQQIHIALIGNTLSNQQLLQL
jgi:hypothetical protein